MSIADFYDGLSGDYHRLHADWEARIARHAEAIAAIAGERWGSVTEVLDLACGIGTQALGLAARGFAVTFAVPRSQLALMQHSFPEVQVVVVGEHEAMSFDYWAALWSLPAALGITLANLPALARFLQTLDADVDAWRTRLAQVRSPAGASASATAGEGRALRIGIVWQTTGTSRPRGAKRGIIVRANVCASAAFSSSGLLLRTEPITRKRFWRTRPKGSAPLAPPRRPSTTILPQGASASMFSSR